MGGNFCDFKAQQAAAIGALGDGATSAIDVGVFVAKSADGSTALVARGPIVAATNTSPKGVSGVGTVNVETGNLDMRGVGGNSGQSSVDQQVKAAMAAGTFGVNSALKGCNFGGPK